MLDTSHPAMAAAYGPCDAAYFVAPADEPGRVRLCYRDGLTRRCRATAPIRCGFGVPMRPPAPQGSSPPPTPSWCPLSEGSSRRRRLSAPLRTVPEAEEG